jgi:hypothetical protein
VRRAAESVQLADQQIVRAAVRMARIAACRPGRSARCSPFAPMPLTGVGAERAGLAVVGEHLADAVPVLACPGVAVRALDVEPVA